MILSILSIRIAQAGDVKGTVADSSNKSPLSNATIRILSQRDSAYVAGAMAADNGAFSVNGLNNGNYILETSYIGYDTACKNFGIDAKHRSVSIDTIFMRPSSVMLKETEVTGVKTEIKVMQDTVEYNADSYKTQPNAVVEDLLKRLPGIEIDSDGKIKAQGKEVSKILVDGKDFFSEDKDMATKNIPADIVDKLQVIDRKSDLARLTGVDDGEEETVINLKVKKDMKQGWFGNVNAGYGTDNRYSGNMMINRFIGESQFSIVGNLNNTNNTGLSGPGAFNNSFGDNGINTYRSLGINFNVGDEKKFAVGGDVNYNSSRREAIRSAARQYLFTDSTSYEDSDRRSLSHDNNIDGNFRMKWEADSFNTIDFRPSFNIGFNDSETVSNSRLFAGDGKRTPVNSSINSASTDGTSYNLSGTLVYNHKFRRRKGRSFSTQISYRYGNTNEDAESYAVNEFFLKPDDDELRDQTTDNRRWNSNISARLTWMEPLGDIKKARFLTFAYRLNYSFNNSDKLVYDNGNAGLLDNDLSSRFRNDQVTQQIRLGYRQNRRSYRLDGGLSINPTMMKSEELINSKRNIPKQWVWNFAPFMRFRYSFSKQRSLALDYRGSTQSPSMTQLQPVADMTDPLRIVVGNPNLVPSFNNRVSLRYNDFNQEAQRSIMAMAGASVTTNSIISKTIFNRETGGQTTTYDNVNGVWSANGMFMISAPFSNRNWHVSNSTFANVSRTVGYNNNALNRSSTFRVSESPSIAFRNGSADIELRPYYNFQITRNSNQKRSDRNVHSYGASLNGSYYTPFGLVLNSNLNYSQTSGYSDGYDREQWIWSAAVSYQFLKDKKATISLSAYDLLGQKQSISQTITANYIEDNAFNSVTRYFMLSFAYQFRVFGKGSSEADMNYDGFNHERRRNRPDGNRPPMDNRRPPMGMPPHRR